MTVPGTSLPGEHALGRSARSLPPMASNPEHPTSEAKWDENMEIIYNEEPVTVAANSGIDSPLDKRHKPPCETQGRSSADLPAPPPRAPETPRPHARRSFQARPAEARAATQPMPRSGQHKSAQASALRERENSTSEAKCDENMVTIQNEAPVAVAANSGVDSPLDKRDNLPRGAHGCPVNTRSRRRNPRSPVGPHGQTLRRAKNRPGSNAGNTWRRKVRGLLAGGCCLELDCGATSTAAPQKSVTLAPGDLNQAQKSATFGHFRPRPAALADRSVPFSNRCSIRIYVISMRSVRFKKPVGRPPGPSDHPKQGFAYNHSRS
jgi:hypothetical protein